MPTYGAGRYGRGLYGIGLVPTPVPYTIQDALDASYMRTSKTVYIDGILTDVEAYSVNSHRGRWTTASISIPLPAPSHIVPNATVEIWDGYEGSVGKRFDGRIPAWEKGFSNGNVMEINALGWSSLLDYRNRFDTEYQGPITIRALFDSVCSARNVPNYRADALLDYEGTYEAEMGANPFWEDGIVTLPANSGPFSWLSNIAEIFGYYIFDDTIGTVRLSRISGQPDGDPVVIFTEGVNVHRLRQVYDTTEIVNYHRVEGVTYEDEIGRLVPISAIPEFINSDPLIPVNDGVNYEPFRSNYLTTQQLAEMVRNRLEIDRSTPTNTVRWSSIAISNLSVGDVVEIESTTTGTSGKFWITAIDTSWDRSGGLVSNYEGWSGGGEPLPAGVDRVVYQLQTSPVHLGDEYVSWYAVPTPLPPVYVEGKPVREKAWDFSIPKRATAINVVFRVHGSNSQHIAGKNEDIDVSRFELWKLPILDPKKDRPHSSGSLPVLNEDYAKRYRYATDDSRWSSGAIALRGFDEEEVDVRLKLISGENKEASLGPLDDFEIKDMYVEVYGTVEPVVLPDESE